VTTQVNFDVLLLSGAMANERSVSLVQQLRVFRQAGAGSEHTPETEIGQLFPTIMHSRKEATTAGTKQNVSMKYDNLVIVN